MTRLPSGAKKCFVVGKDSFYAEILLNREMVVQSALILLDSGTARETHRARQDEGSENSPKIKETTETKQSLR